MTGRLAHNDLIELLQEGFRKHHPSLPCRQHACDMESHLLGLKASPDGTVDGVELLKYGYEFAFKTASR